MTHPRVPIGIAAAQSGVKVPTIRYYQAIGLLPPPYRTKKNWRLYGQADLRRLAFIRQARGLGFTLDAVRALLVLLDNPNAPCEEADRMARARLVEVKQRIAELNDLKRELERLVKACPLTRAAQCGLIEGLARRAASRAPPEH
ncbi:MAG: helix-turn-helix domain-containing protein [Alphaproteobacteria bacterium]|nr:helix-turn-helix domain-containing protein [Alphaproteobacteria bacterium]MBV8409456.1 helix-turn-helix domain-containing protein [Alphaproteobacteria bacterium]